MDTHGNDAPFGGLFADAGEAAAYALMVGEVDDDGLADGEIKWEWDGALPVSELLSIMSAREWRDWLDDELEMARLDLGDDFRWRRLLTEEFEDPVVLVEHEGLHIRDGWHRCAAAVVRGMETIRAVRGHQCAPVPRP